MKKILLAFGMLAMIGGVNAQKVLVGWHTFTGASNPIANKAPDQFETGFSGLLGGEVNPAFATTGGGNGTGTGNSGDNTYGKSISIDPLPTVFNSCVKMSPTNNAKRRVDFQVTNNSGSNVTLGGIHFDYAYVWGADVGNLKISVKHFGAMSDLSNANTLLVENIGFVDNNDKAWHSIDVSLANMGDDITLTNGQKAAFWIELPASGVSGDGNVIIDNIAITDNSTPTTIDRTALSDNIKVYPNPTSDIIKVVAMDVTQVVLMNLTGKTLYQSSSVGEINVSDFPKGLYILKIEVASGEICAKKVMVN